MLHDWSLPATWRRFFGSGTDDPTSPTSPASLGAFIQGARSASARASRMRRPLPVPGSERYWLELASSLLPESARATLEDGLRLAVRTRAYWGQTGKLWPDEQPNEPPERVRFGIYGEALVHQSDGALQQLVIKELKRAVHTLEASDLARIERSRRLVMHSARLAQLYREQGRRLAPREPLEALQRALAALLG